VIYILKFKLVDKKTENLEAVEEIQYFSSICSW